MDFSKLLHGFVKNATWICYVNLSKLFFYISCPLLNKTKLKYDQDFNSFCSFCFELNVLNELKNSMPWVRCAFGNVLNRQLPYSNVTYVKQAA